MGRASVAEKRGRARAEKIASVAIDLRREMLSCRLMLRHCKGGTERVELMTCSVRLAHLVDAPKRIAKMRVLLATKELEKLVSHPELFFEGVASRRRILNKIVKLCSKLRNV